MKITNIKKYHIQIHLLFLFFFFSSCMKGELIAEDKKVIDIKERGMIHTYYDGKEMKKVTLLPEYIAEFSSGKSKFRDMDKSSQTVVEGNRIRIHKINNSTIRSSLTRGTLPSNLQTSGDFSPVFSSNGTDSSLMTLPGTIVVEMERDMNQSEIETWAGSQKIKFQKKLPLTIG
jgi:hypothetical protein